MNKYRHLFFDMDQTVAPTRQPILPEMYELLSSLSEDIVIVSGQSFEKIKWQSNNLPAYRLGQNGNEAFDVDEKELWNTPLTDSEKVEIHDHIKKVVQEFNLTLSEDRNPIEDRGGQITFSPVGNTAPVEVKMVYDPDRKKRFGMMDKVPFVSENLVVKIGGSTSLDYIHKDRHKGFNVRKLIDLKGWNKDECIYFGDGLYPGGNDEAVIGVIETVAVSDHLDTFNKLKELIK